MSEILSGTHSQVWFARGCERIPGGVNSPVRAWSRFGGRPPVITSGAGPRITDVDGKEYIDYVLSWGPLILGHAHPAVEQAVQEAASRGLSFGAPTTGEVELAELLCEALPAMERVRLVNSGTEATMSALRLARAATGRDLIVKCAGCYHGHADHLLVAAGSGPATFGNVDSAGVPDDFARCTLVVPYNDSAAIDAVFAGHGERIAAIIVEPVAGNMGLVLPDDDWLRHLRSNCDRHGTLLIFDEVMSGFRVAWGGYQHRCGIDPDLTCLGKVVGGGLPLAAYGGRASVMARLAPEGPCYQAGTLSGNPIAVAAGLATLRACQDPAFIPNQERALRPLVEGLRAAAAAVGVPFQASQCGTMWGFFFREEPVRNFADAQDADATTWQRWCSPMLASGINLAPSPFEAAFWSSAHGDAEIEATLEEAERAFAVCATGA
ncbi:MAG: glutamate-1-semialdehyde 2,1-aminomutase [Planctomycetota bacterium]